MTEKFPGGVTSDAPLPDPPKVNQMQRNRKDVHPNAVHDRYPPIGSQEAPVVTKEIRANVKSQPKN